MFGVPSGKLLGFLVSHRGIEANLDKIKAIERMEAPWRVKDVQRLNRCITALGRFISRLGRAGPTVLQVAQEDRPRGMDPRGRGSSSVPQALPRLAILVAPTEKDPLLLYIAATN